MMNTYCEHAFVIASGIERVLVPQSETLFVFRDNGDTIQFVKEAQGVVNRFVTAGGGNGRTAVRTQAH